MEFCLLVKYKDTYLVAHYAKDEYCLLSLPHITIQDKVSSTIAKELIIKELYDISGLKVHDYDVKAVEVGAGIVCFKAEIKKLEHIGTNSKFINPEILEKSKIDLAEFISKDYAIKHLKSKYLQFL